MCYVICDQASQPHLVHMYCFEGETMISQYLALDSFVLEVTVIPRPRGLTLLGFPKVQTQPSFMPWFWYGIAWLLPWG